MTESIKPDTPPTVSIVLPTYNRAHVLPLAIRSVLDQDFRDFELIIVNDNASDNTEEVVRSFEDPRIRYYRNDPNLKLPRTLNRGFSLAHGKYLTWTSDDNMFAPAAIGAMVAELDSGKADFVFADYEEFADTGPEDRPLTGRSVKLPDQPDMAKGNSIGACFMYTREVYKHIGDYDPELFLNEDYDYWMRIARQFRLQHIPRSLYYFRRNEESLYCSRFAEVRAGSLLVRYKNKYLNAERVLQGLVELVVANLDKQRNPLLRYSFILCHKTSYRLTNNFRDYMQNLLTKLLRPKVQLILDHYDAKTIGFNDARKSLSELTNKKAAIEYRSQL